MTSVKANQIPPLIDLQHAKIVVVLDCFISQVRMSINRSRIRRRIQRFSFSVRCSEAVIRIM